MYKKRVLMHGANTRSLKWSFLRLFDAFELDGKVAHKRGFPGDAYAVFYVFAAVVHVLQRSGNNIHVVVGVHAARDAEAHEVQTAEAILACHRVAVG